MNNELQTLSKLFTEKLFRIPDYQRGYAWTNEQVADYWSDIDQLEAEGNHYTGVLTLESVPVDTYNSWNDDLWIIRSKSYAPFYVVDGQQRLTTSIILIQCIVDRLVDDTDELNFTSRREIQKKFLFDTKDGGKSRSYLFGYEKDNPSYEYLKTEIFGESSAPYRREETIYTNNLLAAKRFFSDKLQSLIKEKLEALYVKITQRLLFNIFSISKDVDVCVAFETMNNRGKPLSYLELLKNRLIYISTRLNVESYEAITLRKTVNDSWKTIYHNLGRNKQNPLDDDFFLRAHHFLNYLQPIEADAGIENIQISSQKIIRGTQSPEYRKLLNEIFTTSSIVEARQNNPNADQEILSRIHDYSMSLQDAVREWYGLFNPDSTTDPSRPEFWLAKLNKIASPSVYVVSLAICLKVRSHDEKTALLKALERLIFIDRLASPYYRYEFVSANILSNAIKLYRGTCTGEVLLHAIDKEFEATAKTELGKKQIRDAMRNRSFYTWRPIHYLLFEYNLNLQMNSKTDREKIDWNTFIEDEQDYQSIEHIYPQNGRAQYWKERFVDMTQSQRELLKNVVGNLLPLSKRKNSSLSNSPYPEKKRGRSGTAGYIYGSFAENELIDLYEDWTPQAILDRSLTILDFIEDRWGVSLGSDNEKIDMLGLGFVKPLARIHPKRYSTNQNAVSKSVSKKGRRSV